MTTPRAGQATQHQLLQLWAEGEALHKDAENNHHGGDAHQQAAENRSRRKKGKPVRSSPYTSPPAVNDATSRTRMTVPSPENTLSLFEVVTR